MRRFLLATCLCFLLVVPVIGFAQIGGPVGIDIKPGSCPNPFNAKSNGVVPVAIIGDGILDLTTVDPTTVMLQGIPALESPALELKDVTEAAGDPADCYDCLDADDPANFNCDLIDATDPANPVPGQDGVLDSYCGDGIDDLVLYFDTQELAGAIGEADRDDCVQLMLMGQTIDGLPIIGMDSVVIKTKIKAAPSRSSLTAYWGSIKTQ